MVYIMSVPGRIEAIRNIVKWSARDDWASCCEQVFGEHLDPIAYSNASGHAFQYEAGRGFRFEAGHPCLLLQVFFDDVS